MKHSATPAAEGETLPVAPGAPTREGPVVAPALREFGDYDLLHEIARGGMGIVYKARQRKLNRTVAVKLILDRNLAGAEEIKRFYVEAEAAANLQHPGIVAVHEVGQVDGQHFFSMEYVEGGSLADLIQGQPLPARKAAELIESVARSIQYAHEQGVLHRDLKPGNVLLQTRNSEVGTRNFQESAASTVPHSEFHVPRFPKITDFGLAKRIEGDSNLTGTGQILGTPSYMPPEQAACRANEIGPHSDVYALGAILYEMLTGRPPFQAETPLDILMQVLETEPVPPRLLNPKVPRDLETICLKCLQKKPPLRYASAAEMAEDVQRYLEGTPIAATSINLLDRVSRALAHNANEEHFRDWGLALLCFGAVILLAHVAIFALDQLGFGQFVSHGLPRGLMFVLIFAILWRSRRQSLMPTNAAERPVWAVWIGYLLALGSAYLALAARGEDPEALYVLSTLLSGLCFFVLGSFVWGGCYALGLCFLAAAPLLSHFREAASLGFGLLWAGSLLLLGLHYRRLGQRQ